MSTQQNDALQCAADLEYSIPRHRIQDAFILNAYKALKMVRTQHARIADLEAQLESIGAGGVSGPLIGQPQAMPDLSQLTERGAVAWAGVDAQGLRDGGASPSASAGEPSAHIKEPYTIAEIKAKIASNDYSAEMLLQHAMLLLDSVQEDAARLDFLIEQRAYVVSDPDACPGHWLHWAMPDGRTWVQGDEHQTPRAAIDAARKQGARWQSAVRALTLHI